MYRSSKQHLDSASRYINENHLYDIGTVVKLIMFMSMKFKIIGEEIEILAFIRKNVNPLKKISIPSRNRENFMKMKFAHE